MRRDYSELCRRADRIKTYEDNILRFLGKTDAPWAEEHYDMAHKAIQEAEDALAPVFRELHEWARTYKIDVPVRMFGGGDVTDAD